MLGALRFLKKTAISIAILLLLIALFWKPIISFIFHDLPFMGKSFDSAAWSSALNCKNDHDCLEVEMTCLRGPMYRDLERNHLVVGTSETTVMSLVGKPTRTADNNCVDYDLGYCSGLKIDGDYLRVCFDNGEKVTTVSHWQS
ncbi:hypothetical protein A1353_16260 [Methylomonas methanica]|uniref:Uncharacterized protein n=1 Tax=Methylomonas methanica TaxID=421 RepID=A0A177MAF4_METMH|nr:hypothetical protein [Methylomonas methanica]OAI02345.1 hypothetical protein A1353_16260 [Methylomonas methanica]